MTSEDILLSVRASTVRRSIAAVILAGIGLMVLQYGLSGSGGGLGSVLALAIGAFGIWFSFSTWNGTDRTIELTSKGIRETGGPLLVRLEDIQAVDRSAFAFKPSGGFVLKLKSSHRRGWVPGLWWRLGRRFGVGGILPSVQTKLMADLIQEELLKRHQ